MERQTEYELIDELLALKQAGMPFLDATQEQNPVAHYFDEDRFAAETDALFRALPMIAAHASELPEAGSFLRREIGGRSVLLTRDADRQIHAFLNVCRHRGTRLVDAEAGCAKRFSCPYHAWTYGSNGALLAAPHFETGFPDSDKAKLGLTRLPVLEKFGFVWVIAAPDSKAQIADYFAGLGAELDALAIDDMVIAEQTNERRKANWKILIEGGIEAYHFKIAHRSTIGPYFEDNLSTYRCFGPHIRSVLARNTVAGLADAPRDTWRLRDHANLLYTLFPTSTFLVQQDHIVWVSQMPVSAGETDIRLATLVPQARRDEKQYWARNHAITTTTLDEDFAIGESIQSALASGANEQMTFGRYEGALARFNATIADYINAA
ncbi:MAG: aromatic ring-hydroxylating oxygenase subunit alpha [Parvibaculales bacterium]